MKKLKILGSLGLAMIMGTTLLAFKTSDNAPKKVKEAFAKKFPKTKKVRWHKESDAEWEADFKMNNTEYSANFLEDGTWHETEHEIKKTEIPLEIKNTLTKEFLDYKIEEAEISETNTGSVYEFELEKGKEMIEVTIATNGNIVKKEIVKEG